MATSRWPDVVDALVSLARAVTGYRAPDDTATGIPVYDGPEVWQTEERPASYLVVGWSGEVGSPEDSGTSGQMVATMASTRPRDEEASVRCLAVAEADTVADARTAAFQVLADVEDTIRTSVTLGLTTPRMVAQIGRTGSIRQYLAPADAASVAAVCEITFDIVYSTRI